MLKALYKLMKNDVYGKTMENLRNRTDVLLVSNKETIWNGHQSQVTFHKKNVWEWFSCNT